MLAQEYAFFDLHRTEYLRDHAGQYVVIENEAAVGFFPDQMSAFIAMKDHEVGKFLVKKVVPADQDIIEYHTQAIAFA